MNLKHGTTRCQPHDQGPPLALFPKVRFALVTLTVDLQEPSSRAAGTRTVDTCQEQQMQYDISQWT